MTIHHGQTRLVFVIGQIAIKIPNFLKGYRQFLYGIISNHQENFYSGSSKYLLPVLFSFPGSCIIIMPKCVLFTKVPNLKLFHKITTNLGDYPKVDYKAESFGTWKGKMYVIDYGTTIYG